MKDITHKYYHSFRVEIDNNSSGRPILTTILDETLRFSLRLEYANNTTDINDNIIVITESIELEVYWSSLNW